MMTTSADDLAAGYLDRLARASAGLPPSYREELLEQISQHIAAARSGDRADSPAHVRQVLDDLGDPDEVAAAAREQADAADLSAPNAGQVSGQLFGAGTARESAAVILLSIGWIAAGVGWLIGLVLAWTSTRWSTAQKLAATLLPVPVLAALVVAHELPGSFTGRGAVVGLIVLAGLGVSLAAGARLVRRAHDREAG
jgi:uncharacterized membrane protein